MLLLIRLLPESMDYKVIVSVTVKLILLFYFKKFVKNLLVKTKLYLYLKKFVLNLLIRFRNKLILYIELNKLAHAERKKNKPLQSIIGPMALLALKLIDGFYVTNSTLDSIKKGKVGVMDPYDKPGGISILNEPRVMNIGREDVLPGDVVVSKIKIAATKGNYNKLQSAFFDKYRELVQIKLKFMAARPEYGLLRVSELTENSPCPGFSQQFDKVYVIQHYKQYFIEISDNIVKFNINCWKPCINIIKSTIDIKYEALHLLEATVALKLQILYHEPTFRMLGLDLPQVVNNFDQTELLQRVSELGLFGVT